MLSTLYLLKYNNYYNRILKKHFSIEQYEEFLLGSPIPNVNFIPNDGINTEQVINWKGDIPDYILVVNGEEIISRWFVLDAVRTLNGQFKLTLFRDTLADYFVEILDASIFVEKAPLSESDPFIFNSENMTFNQVKKEERLIQDKFKSPWIIGYMTKSNPVNDNEVVPYEFKFSKKSKYNYKINSLDEIDSVIGYAPGTYDRIYDYTYYVKGIYRVNSEFTIAFNDSGAKSTGWNQPWGWNVEEGVQSQSSMTVSGTPSPEIINSWIQEYSKQIGSKNENLTLLSTYMNDISESTEIDIKNLNNLIVYVEEEGAYYRINVETINGGEDIDSVSVGTALYSHLNTATAYVKDKTSLLIGNPNMYTFSFRIEKYITELRLTKVEGFATSAPIDVEIPLSRNVLEDAPYCMFAIPYYENREFRDITTNKRYFSVDSSTALDFVSQMSEALSGAGALTDIQLLPYCPFQSRILGTSLDIEGMISGVDYTYISLDDTNGRDRGIMMLWATESTFSFNISLLMENPFKEVKVGNTVYQEGKPFPIKLWNETTKYRITSPNYGSSFEFSPAKNNGCQEVNIDCTYKPFQPYIHINPIFKGLYGADFDDPRGLICNGDFSLPKLNDAWQTYQWQNINFQNSFDRTIQTMEVKNSIQKTQDIWKAATGTVSGTVGGATTGAFIGGGWGAAAGAIVGGGAALAGGVMDVRMNETLRKLDLDLTKDQFGYNLGNIEALPTTLTKVSAFTANNKIFPVLEVYMATDQEIDAFIYKLGFNGLTVMRIGKLKEFFANKVDYGKYTPEGRNYFKGQLIRIDIPDDFHVVNIIANELNKGVYI